jgi:hypothetical protein
MQTPFIICEDNIFQRKINYNIVKPGLGVTPQELEIGDVKKREKHSHSE